MASCCGTFWRFSLQTLYGVPWPVACLIVLALGALTGILNAFWWKSPRSTPIIATLGTGTVLYALALWHTGGRQVGGNCPMGSMR